MALGDYPVVNLVQARERHFAGRQKLANDIALTAERKAEAVAKQGEYEAEQRRAEMSLENVARCWWVRWAAGKSPRHADYVLRRLETDVFPKFGHKFIENVSSADVRELMVGIERRGAETLQKGLTRRQAKFFATRLRTASRLGTRPPISRDILAEAEEENFARVDTRELPDFLIKMESYDGDALTRLATRLMAYTFVRTSELSEAEWPEFDLDNSRWDIPAARMKMDAPAHRSAGGGGSAGS